jgi:hypothetical protein
MREYIGEEAKLAVRAGYTKLGFSTDSEKFMTVDVSVSNSCDSPDLH